MAELITTIRKDGGDMIFNDSFSIPKDKVTIIKREAGFCTCKFDQVYYSDQPGSSADGVDIFFAFVTQPAAVMDNDDLFEKLVNLKTPA